MHTPLITSSDCEGAGEMFQVTTLDLDNIPRKEDGSIDYSQDFSEIGIQNVLQSFNQSLIHELVKEVHLLRRIFQHIADNMFEGNQGVLYEAERG